MKGRTGPQCDKPDTISGAEDETIECCEHWLETQSKLLDHLTPEIPSYPMEHTWADFSSGDKQCKVFGEGNQNLCKGLPMHSTSYQCDIQQCIADDMPCKMNSPHRYCFVHLVVDLGIPQVCDISSCQSSGNSEDNPLEGLDEMFNNFNVTSPIE
mmetsp:Transcript_55300/g.145871  ORF Transcript_55300/g.145871 Transcript_55300/m.145871 type:complete len:155 (-) Transcript_55300:176-640(-)